MELLNILFNFESDSKKNWDAYSQEFNSEQVMKKFDDVFIKPLINKI